MTAVTDSAPEIDAIIPALNVSKTIEAAIDSALNQIGVEVHVTVVDAGSSDETVDVVKHLDDPRIQLISGKRKMLAGEARNVGIGTSASAWIALLDADDIWPLDRSLKLLSVVSDPANEIPVGYMVNFEDGVNVDPSHHWPLVGSHFAPNAGGTMFSRSVFERVGSFDVDLRVGEFIDWIARARSLGISEVPTENVVVLRRNHANNTSRIRREEYGSSFLSIAQRHRARQRNSSS